MRFCLLVLPGYQFICYIDTVSWVNFFSHNYLSCLITDSMLGNHLDRWDGWCVYLLVLMVLSFTVYSGHERKSPPLPWLKLYYYYREEETFLDSKPIVREFVEHTLLEHEEWWKMREFARQVITSVPDRKVFGPPGFETNAICTDPDPSINKQ